MYGELTVPEAINLPFAVFVDLRSPVEYARGSIPGALNIPLFSDSERETIGLHYKKDRQGARLTGLNFIASRLPEIMDKIYSLGAHKIPVLYCWRGGLRSKSFYNLLAASGIPAYRLPGGYKAYRRYILDQLAVYELQKPLFVLNGLTGTGKTKILHLLLTRGCPGIDLEKLACHRGSLFGHLGFKHKRGQKDFDAHLWSCLHQHRNAPYLLFEGEGKRIGPVYLPPFLFKAMQKGTHILLTAPLAKRVERLLQEYTPSSLQDESEQIEGAIQSLKKYLGTKTVDYFLSLLKQKNYAELVSSLCQLYYDRLYSESKPEQTNFVLTVDSSNLQKATDIIQDYVQQKLNKNRIKTPV